MRRFVLVLAFVVSAALAAWSHAHLRSSSPRAGAVLKEMPSSISLEFTEPIEMKFSRFYLVRLAVAPNATAAQLQAAVKVFFDTPPTAKVRLESGLSPNTGHANRVGMYVDPHNGPGTYAVIWKALSVDGHAVKDSMIFRVVP